MVHTGACIANLLGQGGSRKYHLTCNWLRYFKNDRDRRDLITCGSAAGVAAAFRAPVGGVLFALEEAASWYNLFSLVGTVNSYFSRNYNIPWIYKNLIADRGPRKKMQILITNAVAVSLRYDFHYIGTSSTLLGRNHHRLHWVNTVTGELFENGRI